MAPPRAYGFSVDSLAAAEGVSRRRMLGALRRSGGEPVEALVSLGEDRVVAELLALDARRVGPDGGRTFSAEYRRRVARGRARGARSAREAAGHPGPEPRDARTMAAIFEGTGWATVDGVTDGEARRLGRYGARVGELVTGQLSPSRFRRLVGSWASFRGERFEATPGVVIAIVEARREAGEDLFPYQGRRG